MTYTVVNEFQISDLTPATAAQLAADTILEIETSTGLHLSSTLEILTEYLNAAISLTLIGGSAPAEYNAATVYDATNSGANKAYFTPTGGVRGLYLYINAAPGAGVDPSNATHWFLLSQDGTDGASSSTQTTATFLMPAAGATVTPVDVVSSAGFSVGQLVNRGGNTFEITAKPTATSLTLLAPTDHDGTQATVTGGTVAIGTLSATGERGAAGLAATVTVGATTTGAAGSNASVSNSGTTSAAVFDFTVPRGDAGINAFATIAADFTQPATDANVTVAVNESGGFEPGAVVFTQANYYTVASLPSSTQIELTNSAIFTGNSAAASTITAGKIVQSGTIGPTGSTGQDGTTSGIPYTTSAATAAAAGEIRVDGGTTFSVHTSDSNNSAHGSTYWAIANLPVGSEIILTNTTTPAEQQVLVTTSVFTGDPVRTATVTSSGTAIADGVAVSVVVIPKGPPGANGAGSTFILQDDGTNSDTATGTLNIVGATHDTTTPGSPKLTFTDIVVFDSSVGLATANEENLYFDEHTGRILKFVQAADNGNGALIG